MFLWVLNADLRKTFLIFKEQLTALNLSHVALTWNSLTKNDKIKNKNLLIEL